jgi:hypothetical protein
MSVFETINQGTPGSNATAWPVEVTDGTNVLGTPAHPVKTDPTGTTTQPVNGTVAVSSVGGTVAVTESGTWNIGTVAAVTGITNPVTVSQPTAAVLHATVVNQDGSGNALTSTSGALDSNLKMIGGSAPLTGTGGSGAGVPRVTVANDSAVKLWNGTNTLGIDSTGAATANITEVSGQSLTMGQKLMANSIPICIASDQNLEVTVGAVYDQQTGTTGVGSIPTTAGGMLSIINDNFLWSTLVLNFVPTGVAYGGIFELQGSTDGQNWTALTGTLLSSTPDQMTQYTTTSLATCAARYNLAGFPYIRIYTVQAFTGTIAVSYALTTALGDEVSFTRSMQVDASGTPVDTTPSTQYVVGQKPLGTYYQGGSGSYLSVVNDMIAAAYILPKPSKIGNTIVLAVVGESLPIGPTYVTDSAGNTYTQVVPSSGVAPIMVFTAPIYAVDAEGQLGFTINTGTSSVDIVAHEYSGLITVSPLDATSSNSGTSTSGIQSVTTPTITTSAAEDMVFAILWGQGVIPDAVVNINEVYFDGSNGYICLSSPYPSAASLPVHTLFEFAGLTGNAAFLNGTGSEITAYSTSTGIIKYASTHAAATYTGQNGTFLLGFSDGPNGLLKGFGFNSNSGSQRLSFSTATMNAAYITTVDSVQATPGSTSITQNFVNLMKYQSCIVALKIAATGTLAMGMNGGVLKALATDASGNLNVNVISGGTGTGGGTTSITGSTGAVLDGGQNTTPPQNMLQVGGVYNRIAPSITAGNLTALQTDASGNLQVNIANSVPINQSGGPWAVTVTNPEGGTQYISNSTIGNPGSVEGTVALGLYANNTVKALTTDTNGNLNVNVANASTAMGPVQTAVPGDASYTGFGMNGMLVGVSSAQPLPVAVQSGAGMQYAAATAVPTPTGTVALGWDGTDVRALSTSSTGALNVAGTLTLSTGQVEITGSTGAAMDAAQNTAAPAHVLQVGGVYNSTPPSISTGDLTALQTDGLGSLKVSIAGGSYAPSVNLQSTGTALTNTSGALNVNVTNGAASNAAAAATGSTVPTSAGYTGFNSSGNLVGVSSTNPLPVTVISGSSSGGTQYTPGQLAGASVTGTVAMGAYTTTGTSTNYWTMPLVCDTTGVLLPAAQGMVATAAPTYTTGKYGLLSLNTSGGLRVDGSGVTQPVKLTDGTTAISAAISALGTAPTGTAVQAVNNVALPSAAAGAALSSRFINSNGAGICLKASSGNLYGFTLTNGSASIANVEFFNSATAPTLGTTPVVFCVTLPPSANVTISPNLALMNFSTGIGFAATSVEGGTTTAAVVGMIFFE